MAPDTITDLATARTVIADLQAALARAEGENTLLRQKLDVLCHKLFGKKSEAAGGRSVKDGVGRTLTNRCRLTPPRSRPECPGHASDAE